MPRQPKCVTEIKGFYRLLPGRPDVATSFLKHLYRAVMRRNRSAFYELLKSIENEINQEDGQ